MMMISAMFVGVLEAVIIVLVRAMKIWIRAEYVRERESVLIARGREESIPTNSEIGEKAGNAFTEIID